MRFATGLTTISLLALVACGGGDDSLTGTNNNGGSNNGGSGPMSATVNGASWSAPTPAAVVSQSVLSVAGIDLNRGITISFAVPATGPGTYSTAFNNTNGGIAIVSNGATGQTWATYQQGGTGSVVVTTLQAHRVVGTFAFTAVLSSGTGTITVTNGKFDVTF